jgi:hypothetical protein
MGRRRERFFNQRSRDSQCCPSILSCSTPKRDAVAAGIIVNRITGPIILHRQGTRLLVLSRTRLARGHPYEMFAFLEYGGNICERALLEPYGLALYLTRQLPALRAFISKSATRWVISPG